MAEWVIEHGIGEVRAALIDGDSIVEARILPDGDLIAGTVMSARLVARMPERGQGIVAWTGGEAVVAPLPAGVPQGAETLVEVTRPAIGEPGKPKRALARPATTDQASAAPELPVGRTVRIGDPDRLEAAGWSELLDAAATGTVAFAGGSLTIALTPAMTVIDVDGVGSPNRLAADGAHHAARAIRRLDIGGSIGIDLPGSDKAARAAAADAIDAALPQPFERTAVNGFGFVQIVRPRRRRSMMEIHAMEPGLAHTRALLRRAEHAPGIGERTIVAHPVVISHMAARTAWLDALSRRIGTTVALRADPALAISGGHVQARHA